MILRVFSLFLFLLFACIARLDGQVTINELAANPSERIVKWSSNGVPTIGSGLVWNSTAFNHSAWSIGGQPIGHGAAGLNTDLTSVMGGRACSLYLRKEFTVSAAQAAVTTMLRLQIEYNDGFVAYINGVEIARKNLGAPKHFVYAAQRAYNAAAGSGISDILTVPANQVLVGGSNVLAVQVHNYDLATGLKLDAALSLNGGASLVSSGAAGGDWRYFVGHHEPSGIVVDTKLVTQPFPEPAGKHEEYEDPHEARDWIELRNTTALSIDLAGWTLSDAVSSPAKWSFPNGSTLPAGAFMIVMCDNRFEANTGANASYLHTNFVLEKDGGSVFLFKDGTLVDSLSYPGGQNAHNSFGRSASGGSALVFFDTATPGAANGGTEYQARAAAVTASIPGDFYDAAQIVTLACATVGSTIRYTMDGSDPTESSVVYSSPLNMTFLADNMGRVLRARAFAAGMVPGEIMTHTYLIAQNAALKTLPATLMSASESRVFFKPHGVMSIEAGTYDGNASWTSSGTESYNIAMLEGDAAEREIALEYHYPDSTPGFSIQAGLRLSASFYTRPRLRLWYTHYTPWVWYQWEEKPSFNLYFRGAYGPGKLNHNVFPGYDVSRFDKLRLRSGKNDNFNPHITDELCRRIHMAMGHEGVTGRWTSLYVNGRYKGYYNVVERIREDMLREHYGGSAVWDVIDNNEVEDGSRVAFDSFFSTTLAADLTQPANWAALRSKLDLDNVCDYFLMKIYAAMWDWPYNNWVLVREQSSGPNSVWRFIDWDSEGGFNAIGFTAQNVNFDVIGNLFAASDTPVRVLFNRLRTSPEFRLRFADRVQKHLFNGGVLDDRGSTFWLKTQKDALKAQVLPILTYTTGQAFNESWFTTWTTPGSGRRSYLLGPNGTQLATYGLWPATAAPTLSLPGGNVTQGTTLTFGGSGGVIYYTTDGSDPRLEGGAVSVNAMAYSAAIVLNTSRTIRARMRSAGGEWSPLSEASFTIDPVAPTKSNLVIAEIMYNPPSATLAETQVPDPITNGDDFEFVRIQNIGTAPVLLGQLTLSNGITYAFSGSGRNSLEPGQHLVVVKSLVAFRKRYGTAYDASIAAGAFSGGISNSGETIELRNNGILLHSVTYTDNAPWPRSADGFGPSLLLINPSAAPDHANVINWTASVGAGGQPGGNPHALSWAAWRDLSFHRVNDLDSIKDPDDDPDSDGLLNALEYALGTSPKIADSAAVVLPQASLVEMNGHRHLGLTCRVNPAASEAVFTVETSPSLQNDDWNSGSGHTLLHVAPTITTGGFQTFTTRSVSTFDGETSLFMRLKVTLP